MAKQGDDLIYDDQGGWTEPGAATGRPARSIGKTRVSPEWLGEIFRRVDALISVDVKKAPEDPRRKR